ncbi:Glyoxalase/Bleomycin resistance protein/Dihydroxybiphenyl dioxygenase [Parasponia andersonii]|uniref:Glyoxalase/Bleomycin resistance protein/Dihydroxybiphenyl dioxygenase n=1 Tax=Parasponia andersonii TaxID=3476 RepID=A0A2P5BRV3_PARAD|nr:Glyoxalase/Bleomycin resistance protein/Dihydroxybiphenyl dioxygenase [Parasponia andersonii]
MYNLMILRSFPDKKYSIAVVGFGPEDSHFVIETRYHYGVDKYEIGTGFGEFVGGTVESAGQGWCCTREPGKTAGGSTKVFAFVLDPDGYSTELFDSRQSSEPLRQIALRVTDIDPAIKFYQR